MATVNKDFRVKSGLIVEGANATVNGDTVVTATAAQTLTTKTIGDGGLLFNNGGTNQSIYADGSDLTVYGHNNVYINTNNADIILQPDGNAKIWGDVIATQGYADTAAGTAETNAKGYADGLASNYDVAGAANAAETAANGYTDTQLANYTTTANLDTAVDGLGYLKSADLSGYATETYVNTAVDNLVDGAPGLLDTLNEIAAAIADDANYATTMTTALAGKQNNLTAGDGIDIVSDTISVDSTIATKTYVDNAVSTGVGDITTDNVPEGSTNLYFTTQRAIDAIGGSTPTFTSIDINSVAKQVAATQSVSTASTVTGYSWAKADYKSAKLIVKANTATHSQVSEIIISLDSSDNVAITEFGAVYTNVELAEITADVSGSDVRVRVTTLNASTSVTVVGTLIV